MMQMKLSVVNKTFRYKECTWHDCYSFCRSRALNVILEEVTGSFLTCESETKVML